jgi:transposase-like protein
MSQTELDRIVAKNQRKVKEAFANIPRNQRPNRWSSDAKAAVIAALRMGLTTYQELSRTLSITAKIVGEWLQSAIVRQKADALFPPAFE